MARLAGLLADEAPRFELGVRQRSVDGSIRAAAFMPRVGARPINGAARAVVKCRPLDGPGCRSEWNREVGGDRSNGVGETRSASGAARAGIA